MRTSFIALACCIVVWASLGVTQASAIHDAADRGDLAGVKALLARNPKLLDAKDQEDYTPLHIAAERNRAEVAAYLVGKGANLSLLNADGFTPLQEACYLGNTETGWVIVLKSGKCDIISAVMLGDIRLVKRLLDVNPKLVNEHDVNDDGPLCAAAEFGRVSIAALLLDRGADVNACGRSGSPIARAMVYGRKEVVKLLLDRGADLNAAENSNLLDLTLQPSQDEIAKLLLSRGAKITISYAVYTRNTAKVRALLDANPKLCTSRDSRTPLNLAAIRNATAIAGLLISKGAPFDTGGWGNRPIDLAAGAGSKGIVALLISKGARINAPKRHDSPLHCAIEKDQTDVARLLISKGADPNALGEYGTTPLIVAARRGNKELVQLLIGKKCSVNAKDDFGATAAGWALAKEHKEVAAMLAKHGGKTALPPRKIAKEGPPPMCEPG